MALYHAQMYEVKLKFKMFSEYASCLTIGHYWQNKVVPLAIDTSRLILPPEPQSSILKLNESGSMAIEKVYRHGAGHHQRFLYQLYQGGSTVGRVDCLAIRR